MSKDNLQLPKELLILELLITAFSNCVNSRLAFDILELLIEHGANINATDSSNKGATPLDYAHWKGQTEVIEVLKTHNAQRAYGEGWKGDNKGKATIKITNIGDGSVMLEFKSGILQEANSINGPWEDVDEVSPVTWTADQFSKFARLKFSK